MTRPRRIRPVADDDLTDAQRQLLDPLRGADSEVLNIFRTLAVHPDLTRRWLVFGNHVLGKSTLTARLRELVILRVGWLCGSDYEWGHHVLIARAHGVSDEEIVSIKEGPDANGWSPAERAALNAVDELHSDQEIGDDTWKSLRDAFDEQQCLDIIFTVGQYTLVCMALNSCGVERDAGVPGFDD